MLASGLMSQGAREQAHLSQAVFAQYLNLTVGYVSQLKRGAKRPSGPALVLLDVIRRKGVWRNSPEKIAHGPHRLSTTRLWMARPNVPC